MGYQTSGDDGNPIPKRVSRDSRDQAGVIADKCCGILGEEASRRRAGEGRSPRIATRGCERATWQHERLRLDLRLMPRRPRTIDSTRTDFRRALTLIDARHGEFDFGVAAIAIELSCSPRQVQRIFETNGTTVRAELTAARMQHAARILADRRSVSYTSDVCGYRHARHFATAFRRYYGLRPHQIRKAALLAARLKRRQERTPPRADTPRLSAYVKAWRADHRALLRALRTRNRGTIIDGLFADAIALRGPDLRSRDGKAMVKRLRSSRGRRVRHLSSGAGNIPRTGGPLNGRTQATADDRFDDDATSAQTPILARRAKVAKPKQQVNQERRTEGMSDER
jgi:AraC-like DNA-binding protein